MVIKDKTTRNIIDMENIISNCEVARIAMCVDNKPYIVPLNYGYDISTKELVLYCHCINEGKKLDILRENPNVFVEIDNNGSDEYFTLMCEGKVQFIDLIYDKIYALNKILNHCSSLNNHIKNQSINNINLIKIPCKNITCKVCTN